MNARASDRTYIVYHIHWINCSRYFQCSNYAIISWIFSITVQAKCIWMREKKRDNQCDSRFKCFNTFTQWKLIKILLIMFHKFESIIRLFVICWTVDIRKIYKCTNKSKYDTLLHFKLTEHIFCACMDILIINNVKDPGRKCFCHCCSLFCLHFFQVFFNNCFFFFLYGPSEMLKRVGMQTNDILPKCMCINDDFARVPVRSLGWWASKTKVQGLKNVSIMHWH